MTSGLDWQGRVGDVWAAEWRRTERSLADLARHLDAAIASAAPMTGKALDIGSGAGSTSLALHGIRPGLHITGVDLSPGLVALAQDRAGRIGSGGPQFRCADAIELAEREGPFDLFVSRHGVMFFPDPVTAFSRLRSAAGDGAALVFSCFDDRARNAFATVADEAIGVQPAPESGYQPGPFAFADRDRVAAWLHQAGWRPESAARVSFDYVVGEGDDPVEDALSFLSRIGPAARAMTQAASDERQRIEGGLRAALMRYRVGDRIALSASAWIWRAVADGALMK
ncbi:class I SAM-dependent methyltransferase [Sphingomonas fuzhouensis]|uniref:class I SAM-dependent methyltransferase n=1 Tax=Sphingomonas fuzhouensis TaxID=3106033 RepID=UPI002AFEEF05|nr:class I SAM-dependent methyltransferase [Sphingomonas sp. SGZ-02]